MAWTLDRFVNFLTEQKDRNTFRLFVEDGRHSSEEGKFEITIVRRHDLEQPFPAFAVANAFGIAQEWANRQGVPVRLVLDGDIWFEDEDESGRFVNSSCSRWGVKTFQPISDGRDAQPISLDENGVVYEESTENFRASWCSVAGCLKLATRIGIIGGGKVRYCTPLCNAHSNSFLEDLKQACAIICMEPEYWDDDLEHGCPTGVVQEFRDKRIFFRSKKNLESISEGEVILFLDTDSGDGPWYSTYVVPRNSRMGKKRFSDDLNFFSMHVDDDLSVPKGHRIL